MPVERIYVVPGDEFRRVVLALTAADKAMNKRIRDGIDKGIDPHIRAAKADVSSMELEGGDIGRRGLQREVASGVGKQWLSALDSNFLRVTTTMADHRKAVIPRGMDRRRGWWHPVFGDRTPGVRQPGQSWFMDHMDDSGSDIEENLTDVLEAAAEAIASAGLGA